MNRSRERTLPFGTSLLHFPELHKSVAPSHIIFNPAVDGVLMLLTIYGHQDGSWAGFLVVKAVGDLFKDLVERISVGGRLGGCGG